MKQLCNLSLEQNSVNKYLYYHAYIVMIECVTVVLLPLRLPVPPSRRGSSFYRLWGELPIWMVPRGEEMSKTFVADCAAFLSSLGDLRFCRQSAQES